MSLGEQMRNVATIAACFTTKQEKMKKKKPHKISVHLPFLDKLTFKEIF